MLVSEALTLLNLLIRAKSKPFASRSPTWRHFSGKDLSPIPYSYVILIPHSGN